MADSQFVIENEVFSAFLFYGGLVLLKLLVMSPITITYRILLNNYMNAEDTKFPVLGSSDPEKQKRALVPNDTVNRVKRAHWNDIENIVPFALVGLMYVAITPEAEMAKWLFKVFAGTRYVHSVVYLLHVPQPTRFLAFLVGLFVNVYMAVQVVMACKA